MCVKKLHLTSEKHNVGQFEEIAVEWKLLLTPKKKGAIVDCAVTSLEVKGHDFPSKLMKKAFIDSRLTNKIEVDGDPNIHVIMRASNVYYNSNPGLQELSHKILQHCIAEMFAVSSFFEETCNSLGFPIEVDREDSLWMMNS